MTSSAAAINVVYIQLFLTVLTMSTLCKGKISIVTVVDKKSMRSNVLAEHSVCLCTRCRLCSLLLMFAGSSDTQDFCQSETFQPRCLPGEAVIITKAVYGRMAHDSRCLQDEEELSALIDDPKYMGCFEDVRDLVSARCSGQSDCEIRIPDPEMEQSNPCYKNMFKYLIVTYRCITGKNCRVLVKR